VLIFLCCLATAFANSIPIEFQATQHVYTYPNDWRPAGISPSGLSEIEEAAASFPYPTYVILIRGENLPGVGDGLRRLSSVTDNLMTQWASTEDAFDASTHVVFSVAWGDECHRAPYERAPGTVCQYFLNTGIEFTEGPADFLPHRDHEPHTNLFLQRVRSSPQDPKTGILDVIISVNGLLWGRTSPEALHESAQRELIAAISHREAMLNGLKDSDPLLYDRTAESSQQDIDNARDQLGNGDTESMRTAIRVLNELNETFFNIVEERRRALDELTMRTDELATWIEEAKRHNLDATAYQPLIHQAKTVSANGEVDEILTMAAHLEQQAGVLRDTAITARNNRAKRLLIVTIAVGGSTFAFMVFAFYLVFNWSKLRRRRRLYAEVHDELADRIRNAANRYMDLELDDREDLVALEDCGPVTTEERKTVSEELDNIFAGIQALDAILDRGEAIAGRANVFSIDRVQQAIDSFDSPMDYDTQQASMSLFDGQTRVIQIVPNLFMADLDTRFQVVLQRRNRLKQAAQMRFREANTVFSHAVLDELFDVLNQRKLSLNWVSDHPLFGDLTSDKHLYGMLDELRVDDPLAYLSRLESLSEQERTITERIAQITQALDSIDEVKLETPPQTPTIIVQVEDDPTHTFAKAQMLQNEVWGLLSRDAVTHDTQPSLERAEQCREAYLKSRQQSGEINRVIENIDILAQSLKSVIQTSQSTIEDAQSAINACVGVHLNAQIGLDQIITARQLLGAAIDLSATSDTLVTQKRLIDAWRQRENAIRLAGEASAGAQKAIGLAKQLNDEKLAYETKLTAYPAAYDQAASQMRSYGATLEVTPFIALTGDGPADYAYWAQQLDGSYAALSRAVLVAKRAAEALEAARRAAAERARQEAERQRRKAARSRSSSWSSSSSFSSSSFSSSRSSSFSSGSRGGGSSFSSGGSRGGGGGW